MKTFLHRESNKQPLASEAGDLKRPAAPTDDELCLKVLLMRNYFPKRPSGEPLHTLSKLYDVPVGFVPPYFEAVYCFICGRRRVAVARYRMICLFRTKSSHLNKSTKDKEFLMNLFFCFSNFY